MVGASHPTISLDIFLAAVAAVRAGTHMIPRSANDKEYFPQDWFIGRLKKTRLPYTQQGRNSYPDFWVGNQTVEGFEVKSLAFANGRPARSDYDSNSTIPSGRKQGRDVFLVFFLYTGTSANRRPVHTLSIAHADIVNSDHSVADAHMNPAVHNFGSYGDGFIRNRKMYVFPHPITIDPTGLGRIRLIVPRLWNLNHRAINRVGTISRTVIPRAVDSYSIRLRQAKQVHVKTVPYQNAGQVLQFDVFEAV